MTFFPECGKTVAATAKFCRNCGASQLDDAPSPNMPATAPVTSPVTPVPAPAPVHATPVQPPQVPPSVTAPPVAQTLCGSCQSPLLPSEKFCGICGAPVVATQVPAPAQPQPHPVSKTCNACGAPISETTKFCGGCGVPVGATFRPAEVVPPTSCAGAASAGAPYGEQVIGVIGNARKMKLLGASWDTYALVVTDRRLIMAQLTVDLLNAAYKEAAEKAKAEGKGFLEQVAHQMSVAFQYCQRYETLLPEIALGETKGNRAAVENVRITAVYMIDKSTQSDSLEYHEFILTFQSADGKFEFHIGEDDRFITILRTAYGDKVHMPFGYFRAGAVRIKLF